VENPYVKAIDVGEVIPLTIVREVVIVTPPITMEDVGIGPPILDDPLIPDIM
jgi:hypothetical protein